ncbi:MAG: ion transporter [Bacteroidetes bacterium]|nr:ion transporter [Bacteroidales bacterium]MBU1008971.1 ion transporter [Bacteroidota bacterium]
MDNNQGSFKLKVYRVISGLEGSRIKVNLFDHFISTLILLNIFAIIMSTYQAFALKYEEALHIFEVVSVIIFSVEYLLRLWTADLLFPSATPIGSRFRFAFSTLGLVDLLAILPFYIPLFAKLDLRFLRIVRLMRLFRLFKLRRHSASLKLIMTVLRDVKDELVVTVMMILILIITTSILMFYVEHEAQPVMFGDIGDSIWWAVATLTTVGYGDVYPITGLGRLLGGIITILGVGIVALPAGMISSSFTRIIQEKKAAEKDCPKEKKGNYCPHCGEKL